MIIDNSIRDDIVNPSEYLPKVKQQYLLNNNINYIEYVILSEIHQMKQASVRYILDRYPSLFKSKDTISRTLNRLINKGFAVITEDKNTDLFTKTTDVYVLTTSGTTLITHKEYKPKYTLEEYTKALQVIDHWNSFKCLTSHSFKPYGEVQTKTIETAIGRINDLLTKTKFKWANDAEIARSFHLPELIKIITKYTLKFDPEYLPEDKRNLPKSIVNFLWHYKFEESEFFSVADHSPVKNKTTIDELKEIGISAPVLKMAYSSLSESGTATEAEKLQIQKSIMMMYRKCNTHRDVILDDLYRWKKQYRENVENFNVFLFNYLKYIQSVFDKGNAKPQFLSFRKGNKVMEGFSKTYIDKFNIHLFPSRRQQEKILKSKIV